MGEVAKGTGDVEKGMKDVAGAADEAKTSSDNLRNSLLTIIAIRIGTVAKGIGKLKSAIMGVNTDIFETGIALHKTREEFVAMANLGGAQVAMLDSQFMAYASRWAMKPGEVIEKWKSLLFYVGRMTREELSRSLGLMRLFKVSAEQIGSFEAYGDRVGMTGEQMDKLYAIALKTQQTLQLPPEFVKQVMEAVQGFEEFGYVLGFSTAEYERYSRTMIELSGRMRAAFGKFSSKYIEAVSKATEKTLGWQKQFRKFAVGMTRDMPLEAIETLAIGMGDAGKAMRVLTERDVKKQMQILIKHRKQVEGNAIATQRFLFAMEDTFGPDIAKVMTKTGDNLNKFEDILNKTGTGMKTIGDASQIAQKVMGRMPVTITKERLKIQKAAVSWKLVSGSMGAYVEAQQSAIEGMKKVVDAIENIKGTKFGKTLTDWIMKYKVFTDTQGASLGVFGAAYSLFKDFGQSLVNVWMITSTLVGKPLGLAGLKKMLGFTTTAAGKTTLSLKALGTSIATVAGYFLVIGSGLKGTLKGIEANTKALKEGKGFWEAAGITIQEFFIGFVSLIPDLVFGEGTYRERWLPLLMNFWGNIQDWYYKTFIEGPKQTISKAWFGIRRTVEGLFRSIEKFFDDQAKKLVNVADVIFGFVGLEKEWERAKKLFAKMKDWIGVHLIQPLERAFMPVIEPIKLIAKAAEWLFKTERTRYMERTFESIKKSGLLPDKYSIAQFEALYSEALQRAGEGAAAGVVYKAFRARKEEPEKYPTPRSYVEETYEKKSPLTVTVRTPEGVKKTTIGEELLDGGKEGLDEGILTSILESTKESVSLLQDLLSAVKVEQPIVLDGDKINKAMNQRNLRSFAFGGVG